MRIVLSSFDHRVLDRVTFSFSEKLLLSGYAMRGPVMMPVRRKKWTVLSSPFVHKNARHQLELNRFRRLIDIDAQATQSVQKPLPQIISELNLPYGVDISVEDA